MSKDKKKGNKTPTKRSPSFKTQKHYYGDVDVLGIIAAQDAAYRDAMDRELKADRDYTVALKLRNLMREKYNRNKTRKNKRELNDAEGEVKRCWRRAYGRVIARLERQGYIRTPTIQHKQRA